MSGPFSVVPYEVRHGAGPWQVVRAVFHEYGFEFELGDYDADLRDPAAFYDGVLRWLAVAESTDGQVVGCVAVSQEPGGHYELHRLYVLAEARGHDLGRRLVQWVIDFVATRGCARLELFSDVAFLHAHALYERMGFRRHRFRYADDPWKSPEWGFELHISPP